MAKKKQDEPDKLKIKLNGRVHVISDFTDFDCPFCVLAVTSGTNENDFGVVMHVVPMCRDFEEMNPEVFLKRAYSMMLN